MQPSEDVYGYDDYRTFLADFFAEQKKLKAFFSHRYFARRAGFSSPSYCLEVIKGKHNLTAPKLQKMIKGLGLKGRAATYFETLVLFNQEQDPLRRKELGTKLERIRNSARLHALKKEQRGFSEQWYYAVIRELAAFADWHGDYHTLASLVSPAITPAQARQAVEALCGMGLLIRQPDGSFLQNTPAISTEAIPIEHKRRARRQVLQRGIQAADTMGPEHRYVAYTTLSMSERTYREVTEELDTLRKKVIDRAVEDRHVEKVYEFVLQLFPASERLAATKGEDDR
jgi:uncharacterized protein (TIGR02147 family)